MKIFLCTPNGALQVNKNKKGDISTTPENAEHLRQLGFIRPKHVPTVARLDSHTVTKLVAQYQLVQRNAPFRRLGNVDEVENV